MREYEFIEGLAVSGRARLGPIPLSVPSVIGSRPGGGAGSDGSIGFPITLFDPGEALPGTRSLRLSDGAQELRLDFPLPTPEVSGTRSEAHEASPGIWVVHWPLDEDSWAGLAAAAPEAVVLANARPLFAEGEPFVRAIGEIRHLLGADPLLWTPRVALPHRLALLVYLGVDLVDTTEALVRSAEGEFLTPELGVFDRAASDAETACDCPACAAARDPAEGRHAQWQLDREMRRVRSALRARRLRELVEARLSAEPVLAELLRYADAELGPALEERAPVTGSGSRDYVLRESRRRPEVARFRARFLARYRPPPSKRVLLVLPCSQTKPYRSSPSHRRVMNALEGVPNRARLHVVSVTSPIGLVPRELEDVPPARHYDIPVTHEWEEDERHAVAAALGHLLGAGEYPTVLVHLDRAEYSFLEGALGPRPGVHWTAVDGRTGSAASLDRLRREAEGALAEWPPIEGGPLTVVREELMEVAAFQFGRASAARLFQSPTRLHGRPWFQRLTDGAGKDLATWREERGLFQLTVEGALRMAPEHTLEVEARPEVPMQGDLFLPGIARADPAIRAGDAVRVVRDGSLLAVGEAALPGRLLNELRRGLGVRLRHRVREATLPDSTETEPGDDPVAPP